MQEKKHTDEELAKQVQNGQKELFGELITRFEQRLLRYARKFLFGYEDAEDVVQEVFLKAFANIQSFDLARNFSAWLYRIAHNEFINFIKKKGREPVPFFNPDEIFPHPVAKENPSQDLTRQETIMALNKSLQEISVKYREILVLYYVEELDYKEIADILHIPVSTVGIRLMRGREILKKIYLETENNGRKI